MNRGNLIPKTLRPREGSRSLREPPTVIYGDLYPLILLSADVAPLGPPLRFLVEASGTGRGCASNRRRGEAKGK
jgi:hypothetical protein